MKQQKRVLLIEILFIMAIFAFLLMWMTAQPFNVSPDEGMRYRIVDYLVRKGTLPHGGDPELRDAVWGISYAFNPILSYMASAVLVKITSFFTNSQTALLYAARMVNVLLGTATAYLVRRIAKRLFSGGAQWLFTILVVFLPGAVFIFSYVNNDGLAVFSTALIILMWIRAMQDDWTIKNCIGLAIGISLCALSYYNAYGVILASVLFFGVTILLCRNEKGDFKFLFSRGMLIVAIVLVLAGWWFVRSYIIYDGDLLGMKTSSMYAEMYAMEDYKPSNRITMAKQGMHLSDMFMLVPGWWQHNWIITVLISFIGTFGYMDIFMPYSLSKICILFFAVGLVGLLIHTRRNFSLSRDISYTKKQKLGSDVLEFRIIHKKSIWKKESVFRWCMVITAVLPFILLVYYAYFSEFQAQGRYLMPGLIAIMYFVTMGYQNLLERFVKNEKIRQGFYIIASVLIIAVSLYTYFGVFAPAY